MNKEKGLKIAAWSLAAVVLGSALVYYNFIDKPIPSVEAGTLCPEFSVTVLDYENEAFAPRAETVSVSDYRGKILILNFWSTTCGSCMEEMPHFNEFQKAYADQVEILALDGETNLNQSQVISWMNKFRTTKGMEDRGAKVDPKYQWDTFDMSFGWYDVHNNDVGALLGFSYNWPATVILDKNGFIKYKHVGALEYEDLESIITRML